jgi:hypothetical protein
MLEFFEGEHTFQEYQALVIKFDTMEKELPFKVRKFRTYIPVPFSC